MNITIDKYTCLSNIHKRQITGCDGKFWVRLFLNTGPPGAVVGNRAPLLF